MIKIRLEKEFIATYPIKENDKIGIGINVGCQNEQYIEFSQEAIEELIRDYDKIKNKEY